VQSRVPTRELRRLFRHVRHAPTSALASFTCAGVTTPASAETITYCHPFEATGGTARSVLAGRVAYSVVK
jgi:hypothetical protein